MVLGWVVIALGLFVGVIPFVGPLFNFGMGPDPAWVVTTSRIVRHVIPAAVIVVGGVMLLPSARSSRVTGATLALLGAAWVTVAPVVLGRVTADVPPLIDILRPLTYHYGTGLLIAALTAFALGRASAQAREPASERRREAFRAHPREA